jgi:hypothetical protein
MNKLLIAAGTLAASAGVGSAADMRRPLKAKPIVDPPFCVTVLQRRVPLSAAPSP